MSDSGLPPARRLWERIETERNERGWTTVELERRSGVPRSTVARWKTGKRPPLADRINPLADVFGIPRKELLAIVGLSPTTRSFEDEITPPSPISAVRDVAAVQGDPETEALLARLSPRRRKMLEEFRESERRRLERLAEDAAREAKVANDRFASLVRNEADESGESAP